MVNADWEIERINKASAPESHAAKDTSYPFLRQMLHWGNPDMYTKDIVLEILLIWIKRISFTWQRKLHGQNWRFPPLHHQDRTPFQIWLEISEGKNRMVRKPWWNGCIRFRWSQYHDEDGRFLQSGKTGEKPHQLSGNSRIFAFTPFIAMDSLMPFNYILGGAAGILAGGFISILAPLVQAHTVWTNRRFFRQALAGLIVIVTGVDWQLSIPFLHPYRDCSGWLPHFKDTGHAYYSCNITAVKKPGNSTFHPDKPHFNRNVSINILSAMGRCWAVRR